MADAAKDVNRLFAGRKHVALVIDESGEEKKGIESVGVGHQYCGSLGKTCTSQVAVYGALVADNMVSFIDTRLYLPKSWTDDAKRCDKVGIPEGRQIFKTKAELETKEKKTGRGRTPTRLLPNKKSINAYKHIVSLNQSDWQKVTLRNGTKGVLEVESYNKRVYLWDETENKCLDKLLIVSRKKDSKGQWEYKYAFSNHSCPNK